MKMSKNNLNFFVLLNIKDFEKFYDYHRELLKVIYELQANQRNDE